MDNCLFCKIIKGEIPSTKIYEDDEFYAFLDIKPINQGHTLVVPKKHCRNLLDFPKSEETDLMEFLKKVAKAVTKGVGADGFNLGMNNEGAAGQVVFHAHFHIIPRFKNDGLTSWPHKEFDNEELERIKDKIVKYL
ncbi:MAG: HIT family protein [Nanoarchaeota archaeon]|nr:HIT family protein [Nanoarchaeota archaeon]MBU1269807.1 HIT family protein [Nanoarchaeota archaeon]MBU1604278.1 HIT family protein [Nanoarchaeota archaeon]MBU2442448.1 HIT family protein [Nanoarchaeota archaeon]